MTLPPVRVTLIINSLEGGGAERVVSNLVSVFAARIRRMSGPRPDLRLVLLDDAPARYALPQDAQVEVLDCRGSLARSVVGLTRALRRCPPDITLSFLTRANLAAVAAARWGGWPCILSERVNTSSHFGGAGARDRLGKLMVRMAYPLADRIIAVSRGVADDLAANHRVPPGRLAVVYNPYDLDAIAAAGLAAPALDLPRPYLVAAGRLTANKNHSMLLQAYARSGLDEDLVILGEGEDRPMLEAEIAALGLHGRVWLPGFLDNPHAVVARARAFVSASNAEGFPNAAAEAMALGRVAVLTDCPSGPAELLDGAAPQGGGHVEARYGILTPVEDAAAMAAAMRRALEPEAQARFSALAVARMRDFHQDSIADAYADEIAATLATRG